MNTHELVNEIIKQIRQPIWSNWMLKEKIGSGSFSEVYRIEASRGGRIDYSALKIEPLVADGIYYFQKDKELAISRKVEAAKNESDIMHMLKECPYIVRYEDELMEELYINDQLEGYYLLLRMEFLTCVYDMLLEKTFELSEKNVGKLALDISRGINEAHMNGILHRDIKPDNIFINQNGVYKLGDFNISKQIDKTRTYAGANEYMAPEVYRIKKETLDGYTDLADIYSFGITLYYLMNNLRFPFEDIMDSERAFGERMAGTKLLPPKNASDDFGKIILRACEFKAEERFQTMQEMVSALESVFGEMEQVDSCVLSKSVENQYQTVYADDLDDEFMGINSSDEMAESINDKEEKVDFDEIRELAKQGDSAAQYRLGMEMIQGNGVKKNEKEGIKWLRKSAAQGYAKGQYYLGEIYEYGRGVKADKRSAIKWYTKSAEQGYVKAQYILGEKYYFGKEVEEDSEKAFGLWLKAAMQGHMEAQYKIGIMYYLGVKISGDREKAIYWWRMAAGQGHEEAQRKLDLVLAS